MEKARVKFKSPGTSGHTSGLNPYDKSESVTYIHLSLLFGNVTKFLIILSFLSFFQINFGFFKNIFTSRSTVVEIQMGYKNITNSDITY